MPRLLHEAFVHARAGDVRGPLEGLLLLLLLECDELLHAHSLIEVGWAPFMVPRRTGGGCLRQQVGLVVRLLQKGPELGLADLHGNIAGDVRVQMLVPYTVHGVCETVRPQ